MRLHSPLLHLLAAVLMSVTLAAPAAPIDPEQVPPDLRDWTGWVLYQEEEKTCPFTYSRFEQHRCAWPTALELQLDESGGRFEQDWLVHVPSWVALPGNAEHWPQEVQLGGRPAVLVQRAGRPQLRLEPGRHRVSGRFDWSRLPESLAIPKDTGLIALTLSGRAIAVPDIDDGGSLWLRDRSVAAKPTEEGDRLRVQVYRRVIDEIPLQLVTRIELEVSGTQREEQLRGALPAGFIPLSLVSRLPARLEADGTLRVQLRPGRWTLDLAARHPSELPGLALESWPAPWPAEEVWAFDARNHLRLVEVDGPASVDPRQTGLPEAWHNLPAWLMSPGAQLQFRLIRRGDPDPEPDQLHLARNLWLDFDGGGYTVQDQVSGSMTRGWRLEANAPLQLGRAALDGEAQFITRLPQVARDGIEVRRGRLELTADSRLEGNISALPAVGWNHDFQSVGATLHLPPGWELLAASGVDNVPDTWIKRWTLLDIFLVLIAALAVRGLWHWKLGLFALFTLALIWHEPGAPRYVWLNILAAIALLRVLPETRFQALVRGYRNLAWLALVIIAVPFMVDQVRTGLYPQLESLPYAPVTQYAAMAPAREQPMRAPAAVPQAAMELAAGVADSVSEPARKIARAADMALEEVAVSSVSTMRNFNQVDPDANVQTGPGLPDWHWRQVSLGWNGPVQKDQQVSLWLLSPGMNFFCNLLRVLCIAALGLVMLGVTRLPFGGAGWRGAVAGCTLLLLPAFALHAPDARAELPSAELLQELKNRLLAPPECLPECAQSPRLRLELDARALTLRLEIHAAEAVSVPLPARAGSWLPAEVVVDGAPAQALMRANDGTLWIGLAAGTHQLLLRGIAPAAASFQLPLQLPPRRIEVDAQGWTVEGVADRRPVGRQLQFTRASGEVRAEETEELQPLALPPFVRIQRTLSLGLDWNVATELTRISPPGTPVVIAVPLLPGEAVTSEEVKVEGGRVLVNLSAADRGFAWSSSLEKTAAIELVASDSTAWSETWLLDVSPIWHLESEGIAVVHHQDADGNWLPQWRPWPGERVRLAISRPEGVAGQTLTIDRAQLQAAPGLRATDTQLVLGLRSSQGGQHAIALPPETELQSVSIGGVVQPIRLEGGRVTLPLVPGSQEVALKFRSANGIEPLFRTAAIDLGAPAVNARLNLTLGRDRWVLLAGGPQLGPAVLFWGVLCVVVLLAAGLGRVNFTPLRSWHWILLGVGLTQTSIIEAAIIVGWLLALGGRARLAEDTERRSFNLLQIALAALTLIALVTLFNAVKHGLLGLPEMQVAGNGSTAWDLHWYQDRSAALLPQAWVLSVPLWAYRALMLGWALWLAFALLGWLRWGWQCLNTGGIWKSKGPAAPTPSWAEDK